MCPNGSITTVKGFYFANAVFSLFEIFAPETKKSTKSVYKILNKNVCVGWVYCKFVLLSVCIYSIFGILYIEYHI